MISDNGKPDENGEGVVSFAKDIQFMMFGLGDSSQPLLETAEVIEGIVLRQMSIVMSQAKTVAQLQGEDIVAPDHILFLMRKDLEGLKRLIDYLGIKDERQLLNKMTDDQNETMLDAAIQSDESPITWNKNRKQYCIEFLRSIGIEDLNLELADDSIKFERQSRANQQSLFLSNRGYENFHASRRASFGAAQVVPKRFLNWLKLRGGVTLEIKPAVAEICVYLAKETVAQLIDRALILREEHPSPQLIEPPPITVEEIREVMRRSSQLQSFPFSIFSRDVPNLLETRLLAC